MYEPRRVLLLLQATRGMGRGLLRGIARYASLAGPWTFYRQPHAYLHQSARLDLRTLRGWNPDGAFCAEEEFASVARLSVPTLIYNVDAYDGDSPVIVTEDRQAGELAARHLLEQGHRHFAFCGYGGIGWSDTRCEGFTEVTEEAGLSVHIYPARRRYVNWAKEEPRVRSWLTGLPRPLGLFCANDDRAELLLQLCRSLGYGVPEDISLVGVDDDEYVCTLQNPPLSSVRIAADQAGYEGAALLDRIMKEEVAAAGQRIVAAATGVTMRQSTSLLMMEDPEVRKALRFIRENSDRQIQVADVVRSTGLSHRSLNARFHEACGCSILRELTNVRIGHISRLLTDTRMRIHEIAALVGYEDERHIARYFKRATGITPQAYRQRYAMP